jgi:hypothetical protein
MLDFNTIRSNEAYSDLSDEQINTILSKINKKPQIIKKSKPKITFESIRSNPSYDDLSDDQINKIINKIGTQQKQQNVTNVDPNENDKIEMMKKIMSQSSFGGMPTPLPFNPDVSKDLAQYGAIKKTMVDPTIGALKSGQEILNLPSKLAGLVNPELAKKLKLSNVDIDKVMDIGDKDLLDEGIQEISQFLPSFFLPEANIGKLGTALSSVKGGGFATKALESGLPQAGYFATQSENPIEGFGEGLALNTALMGAGGVLDKGRKAIDDRLRNLMSSLSTYDIPALQKAKEMFRGSKIDLGNVLKNPQLKSVYENALPAYSMAPQKQREDASKFIIDKLEKTFSKYGINDTEVPSEVIQKSLIDSFKSVKNEKNNLYKEFNDKSEKIGDVIFNKTENIIKDVFPDFDASILLSPDKDVRLAVEKIKAGKPLSIKDASLLSGKVNESMSAYKIDPSIQARSSVAKLQKIKKSLTDEIDNHVESFGDKSIIDAHKKAKQYYSDNFSKFLDKKIYKYVSDNDLGMSEKITKDFLKTQKEGNPIKELKKLTELSPQSTKENILKDYLGASISESSPQAFATKVKKLSPKQRAELFGEDLTKAEDFVDLTDAGGYALRRLFNPETGSKLNNPFADITKTNPLTKALSAVFGKGLSNRLTNDAFRDKVIDKIIKSKSGNIVPKESVTKKDAYKLLRSALMSAEKQ